MFKRILVAVDASQTGELALETAIRLATESQAQLRIVHVVDAANINIGAELADQYQVPASVVDNAQKILNPAERVAGAAGVGDDHQAVARAHERGEEGSHRLHA